MRKIIKILFLTALSGISANCDHDSLPTEVTGKTTVYHDITLVSILGGTFKMGDTTGNSDEKPVHTVSISAFEMGAYEITNAQYATYLNEALADEKITVSNGFVQGTVGDNKGYYYINLAGYSYSAGPKDSCWVRFDGAKFVVSTGKGQWPVVYVTWYGAEAFAEFYGLDLPTEAEWEYTSRGGRQLEWGTDDGLFSLAKGNVNANGHPVDVGGYPPNPFGLYDLVGNVGEWCHDWYNSDYYRLSVHQDPKGPSTHKTTEGRVIRGSSWFGNDFWSRSAARVNFGPDGNQEAIGFRVVRR